jgi:hypothetical protein
MKEKMTEENNTPGVEPTTTTQVKKKSTMRIIAGVAFLVLGILLVAQVVSQLAKPALASNEQIQNFYGFAPVENPNFEDNQFLRINETSKLVEVCERPTVDNAQNKAELKCETPL